MYRARGGTTLRAERPLFMFILSVRSTNVSLISRDKNKKRWRAITTGTAWGWCAGSNHKEQDTTNAPKMKTAVTSGKYMNYPAGRIPSDIYVILVALP